MKILDRPSEVAAVRALLARNPAVALLGPRQCGKTTLARFIEQERPKAHWFDLEDPRDAQRLAEPMTALEPLRGLVNIDEVQRAPAFFPRTLRRRKLRMARGLSSNVHRA